jgi:hypothetical protein
VGPGQARFRNPRGPSSPSHVIRTTPFGRSKYRLCRPGSEVAGRSVGAHKRRQNHSIVPWCHGCQRCGRRRGAQEWAYYCLAKYGVVPDA